MRRPPSSCLSLDHLLVTPAMSILPHCLRNTPGECNGVRLAEGESKVACPDLMIKAATRATVLPPILCLQDAPVGYIDAHIILINIISIIGWSWNCPCI